MKCIYICLFAGMVLSSCNRMPTACFMPMNVKAVDTFKVGETINFDAGCSIHATKFSWRIKDSLNTVDSNVVISTNKYYSHKFDYAGFFSIRLTAKNSSSNEASIEKNYFIKP